MRESIFQIIHWKDWCWSQSSNTLATSLEKTLMLGKTESKRRGGWQRMRWLDSITDSRDMNLSKPQETMEHRGAWRAAVHGVAKSQTWLREWTAAVRGTEWIWISWPYWFFKILNSVIFYNKEEEERRPTGTTMFGCVDCTFHILSFATSS